MFEPPRPRPPGRWQLQRRAKTAATATPRKTSGNCKTLYKNSVQIYTIKQCTNVQKKFPGFLAYWRSILLPRGGLRGRIGVVVRGAWKQKKREANETKIKKNGFKFCFFFSIKRDSRMTKSNKDNAAVENAAVEIQPQFIGMGELSPKNVASVVLLLQDCKKAGMTNKAFADKYFGGLDAGKNLDKWKNKVRAMMGLYLRVAVDDGKMTADRAKEWTLPKLASSKNKKTVSVDVNAIRESFAVLSRIEF